MQDIGKMRGALGVPALQLGPVASAALDVWRNAPPENEDAPHTLVRYVSLDIATTGLRPGIDRLTDVAAVGVSQGAIGAGDVAAFDLPGAGESGAAEGLAALLAYLGKAPLLTFQAAFVDAFLHRALNEHLGIDFAPAWIDLAWVLPELFGQTAGTGTLDDWLQSFAIRLPGRRQAMSDAVAVARLFLAAQAEATRRGIDTPRKLREIEGRRRWLGRG